MSIIETRLSARLEVGLSVVPARMTDVQQLRSGMEHRNSRWANARRRFTTRYAKLPHDARDELLHLWMACEGMTYGFLLQDPSDPKATNQSLGNAPSGTTPVQLVKTYSYGSRTHTRTITRPLSTAVVYQSGVAKAGTVDTTTGIFTPSTSWSAGSPLTWTGQFLVPVRFATDEPEWTVVADGLCEINADFIEVIGE